jgi:hypothetical protein
VESQDSIPSTGRGGRGRKGDKAKEEEKKKKLASAYGQQLRLT